MSEAAAAAAPAGSVPAGLAGLDLPGGGLAGLDLPGGGLVRASALAPGGDSDGSQSRLPVDPELGELLPGGLPRGSTVTVSTTTGASGGTSLMLAVMAGASQAGSWCAVVGLPALSLVAAAGTGVDLDRLVVVPDPGKEPARVVGMLLEGFDIVALAMATPLPAATCSRLSARARNTGAVLLPITPWPGALLALTITDSQWHGRRRLRSRRMSITVARRGAGGRPRRHELWLPADLAPFGAPAAVGRPAQGPKAARDDDERDEQPTPLRQRVSP